VTLSKRQAKPELSTIKSEACIKSDQTSSDASFLKDQIRWVPRLRYRRETPVIKDEKLQKALLEEKMLRAEEKAQKIKDKTITRTLADQLAEEMQAQPTLDQLNVIKRSR